MEKLIELITGIADLLSRIGGILYGEVQADDRDFTYDPDEESRALLPANDGRVGLVIVNDSSANLLVRFSNEDAGANGFTYRVPAQDTLEVFRPWWWMYKGPIEYVFEDATSGEGMVTEFYLS